MDLERPQINRLKLRIRAIRKECKRLSDEMQALISQVDLLEDVLAELECDDSYSEQYESTGTAVSAVPITYRKPDEVRREEYKSMKLVEAIFQVAEELREDSSAKPTEMTIDDFLKAIYEETLTDEEKRACRATMTSVLNRCVTAGRLTRIKPGVFTLNYRRHEKELFLMYRESQENAVAKNGKAATR